MGRAAYKRDNPGNPIRIVLILIPEAEVHGGICGQTACLTANGHLELLPFLDPTIHIACIHIAVSRGLGYASCRRLNGPTIGILRPILKSRIENPIRV